MAQTAYLDFELKIGAQTDGCYAVEIIHSPREANARLQVAAIQDLLALKLDALSPKAAQAFGRMMFDALLSSDIRNLYDVSRQMANAQRKGLRFKLHVAPPELQVIPWEFLYDPRDTEFLALSRHTPIVRYLELPQPVQPLLVTLPLRILGMVASPRELTPLDVDHEKALLEEALNPLREHNQVELVWLEGETWRDLQRALQGGPWHIFHFIGHAGFDETAGEGELYLSDEQHEIHRLHATELERLLNDHMSLRLAILNSCESARGDEHDRFSSTAAILVRGGLAAVLAMQTAISDQAAIEFTRSFYRALAADLPVDAAVSEARKAMSLDRPDSVEWSTPVLFMRAAEGHLWRLNTAPNKMIVAKGIGQQIDRALGGSAALFQLPEVHTTAIAFRTDFAAASEQIELLSNYKSLHDVLHQLEFLCYKGIAQELPRFPQEEIALQILTTHELNLQGFVQELQGIVADAVVPATETMWIAEVVEAHHTLQQALQELNAELLKRTIRVLGRVLDRHPTRINGCLVAAARALRLAAIVQALETILAKLKQLSVEQKQIQPFEHGAAMLKALNQELTELVNEHDGWQEVDFELRHIELLLDQAYEDLPLSWPRLKAMTAPLAQRAPPDWVQTFSEDCAKLDEALASQNQAQIRDCFKRVRHHAEHRFFRVDTELKNLCGELRLVGTSLTLILQVLDSTNGQP